jgi:hypothetical protein
MKKRGGKNIFKVQDDQETDVGNSIVCVCGRTVKDLGSHLMLDHGNRAKDKNERRGEKNINIHK